MLSFKPIDIEDRNIITSCIYPGNCMNCDFSFANMCSWRFVYKSEFAVSDGFLLIRFFAGEKRRGYMYPVGSGDLRHVVGLLEDDARAGGYPLWIFGVTPDAKRELENCLPGEFAYTFDPDYFDYVYLRTDLAALSGKKYQSKRNHVNRFKKQYRYEYIPITSDVIPLCMNLESKWFQANSAKDDVDGLRLESRSMRFALNHFDELGLTGGAIAVDGEIVAFTYGSPINHCTFGVHVEKANIRYDGVFSLINQEFASHIPEQFIFVNREEDLGIPGLRRAKQSYHPAILLEKNTAVRKTQFDSV
ncbi:MAG: phosphatidylglycerol lysyltransferase domain-containing protein [Tannerella sp.]|nr:phosphatidylglycerol lysyltransferase domain-containing protein [Tannerella sp.]